MPTPIVECIPNFSEGRRPEVVAEILDAIKSVDGVIMLDSSSDPDHNRSVITFVGSPQAVEEGAFAGIAKAAELIDLDKHEGAHPRLGATDVVPFVPISGVKLTECVEIARRLGKRVGEELGIPVYLYEKAAARPDRENLANIRKGEYELLKKEIRKNPDRKPDFGPEKLGSAGATVIGARSPLIAYNVYLNTDDVSVAEKIGKAVRHLSGGLRFVKGLGMLVEGQAQVSMNLTNYKRTPVYRVVEMIRREAARYGAQITHTEIVGLIPQKALTDAAVWYLQLDDFEEDQILESRMRSQSTNADASNIDSDFLEELASSAATPGGGSAAAYTASMAAGLVAMVGRLTVRKKKYKEVEERMWALIEKADRLRIELSDAVARDSEAFEAVMTAFKLPKSTDEEKANREAAVQQTTLEAAKVPLDVAAKSLEVMALAQEAAQYGNLNAITDAGSAAAMGRAALRSAGLNVKINLASLSDQKIVKKLRKELQTLEKAAKKIDKQINEALAQRAEL